jgi:hypothetical protein
MADRLLEVRWFGSSRFQNATGKTVAIVFSDTMTLCVHSGNDKFHLGRDYERYDRLSAQLDQFVVKLNDFVPE